MVDETSHSYASSSAGTFGPVQRSSLPIEELLEATALRKHIQRCLRSRL